MIESCSTLRVHLFGHFTAERGEQIIAGLESRRLQEVFSYLLLNRHRRCSREFLASLFWGESSTEQSKRNLRQVLWQLQTALEAEKPAGAEYIINTTGDWLQINPNADLWLDVDFFEQAWNQTRQVAGEDLDVEEVELLYKATGLHREILLSENYEDWCLRERERLLSHYMAMLEKLMAHSKIRHDYEGALHSGLRILDFDRARETTHQQIMLLYYFLGKRVEALKQYQRCEAALLEELGAPPSKSTQTLYQRIFLDQMESDSSRGLSAEDLQGEVSLLAHILSDLQQVQSIQTHAQRQIDFRMQKIEQILYRLARAPEPINKGLPTSERKKPLAGVDEGHKKTLLKRVN